MDTAKVQHVTKQSSDELLRKFAEVGCEEGGKRRRKKRREYDFCDSPSTGGATVVERRSLLPPKLTRRSLVLRQLRVRNKSSLFGNIHKTWRRTVEGASRVLLEKHYNRHKRLINDSV
ncbi:hypothetical protein PHAVU_001G142300 [Phaseolus vulgaris]|uniref:Uncharacterized protein n=1 Tax=Phaseolus vulgaris TaxID=3885 RepID=V7CVW8_PHAVU|nr:hypothetical protein PHAVU_001G142300g [Phaseolus vulgaris]ESW34317.1 hypothetical protein PHAVU_001G142300g [Phaseolus vulgaris]